jgi:hypothetical protein
LLVVCGMTSTGAQAQGALIRLHGTADSGPVWNGAGVLVAIEAGKGAKLREFSSDGSSVFLAALPRYSTINVALSGQLLAVQGVNTGCDPKCADYYFGGDDIAVGSPGAPLRCLASMSASYLFPPGPCNALKACPDVANDLLVSGETLAWGSCREPERTGYYTAVARPLTGTPPETVTSIADPEALAGNWLVGLAPDWRPWEAPGEKAMPVLVERDLLTGQEPVHVVLPAETRWPSLFAEGEYPAVASVQPDGTVAYVLDAEGGGLLYTVSPTEPAPRVVGPWGAATSAAIAREAPSLLLRDGIVAGRLGGGMISLERLDGTAVTSVRSRGEEGFDFDGSHLAIVETPCTESFVQTWSVGEPPPRPPAGQCPAARLGHVSFDRGNVLVRLSCPALPDLGCRTTTVWFELPKEVESPAGEHSAQNITMLPGTSRTVTIHLPPGWLRRHRHRRVRVELETDGASARSHVFVRVP